MNWKHGGAGQAARMPEYNIWSTMVARTTAVPGDKMYPYYSGRGIKLCERWRSSFADFYNDMGPRPGPGYSVERVDNDGDYSPENCRWATRKEQALNTRRNLLITIGSQTKPLKVWTDEMEMTYPKIWKRLRRGWTPEQALELTER